MIYDECDVKPAKGAIKNRKRKGRGNASGKGGECGRGHKGQRSRSGCKLRPGFEGGQTPLYRRIPKKPGMKNRNRINYRPINIFQISMLYKDGEDLNPKTMFDKRIIKKDEPYKILSDGELKLTDITIETYKISKAALKKLQESGIKVNLINSH
tara:strand:- start:17 stop:478 length:462 start_codon:yes stop_codon:yes gene_type:complete